MKKFKIIVCDHIQQKGIDILENDKDIEYINIADIPKSEIYPLIEDADIVITRSSTDVDEKFLNSAKKLKGVLRAGVGVDNVDIDYASKKGVIVMNVPTANTLAAVELTMGHILSCARSFPYAHSELKDKRVWKRENWYGMELAGKRLGIIGFGNIGSRVGVRAKAFEMDVVTYDPFISPTKATKLGVEYSKNLDDVLESCDIITIHTPKTKETIDMISDSEIEKLKDGAILINCARGGLYNEDAIYRALKSKKIKFAGIDVFSKEPATSHKLLDLDNICVTPHLGANTVESQQRIATQAAENAILAAKGISYPNALNLPIKFDESELPKMLEPYLELTQKIGFLMAQTNVGEIESIKVESEGEISKYLNYLITSATVGALRESIGDKVNYVNAIDMAKERGIKIESEMVAFNSGYNNKTVVKLTTNSGTMVVGGTVFEESLQRIIKINNFSLDIEPKGNMILFKNSDIPGVIGDVGSTLAKHNINISDFRLARDSKKSEALAVILTDSKITEGILEELKSLKACLRVTSAELS